MSTHIDDKTYESSIKQSTQLRGRKRYKMEGPKTWQMINLSKKADCKGNRNKSSTQTPSIMRSIVT
jgi:hypothetical protein